MNSSTFSDIINSTSQNADHTFTTDIPTNWMQGRTTYGGLSAALCLEAVQRTYPELPPLRSAHVSFAGPVGGTVSISTKLMRQGGSVCFISAELQGEKGLATHVVFCFGSSRPSRIDQDFMSFPDLPSPQESEDFFTSAQRPPFTHQFDCLLAEGDRPITGSKQSTVSLWVRHKDKAANNLVGLLSLADMPPPALLPMFEEFKPVSSMTWSMNFLTENIDTQDGWWLLKSIAEHGRDGYSSQNMEVWNSHGQLVIAGRQNVAMFY